MYCAQHISGLPDGSYGGNPMGFIVYTQQKETFIKWRYGTYAGYAVIPQWAKLNFAVLPIGGNFTMDAADAVVVLPE